MARFWITAPAVSPARNRAFRCRDTKSSCDTEQDVPVSVTMKDVADIVSRLGGREAVADRFAVTPKAVEMWETRGAIPGRWHVPMLMWADEAGVSLSVADFAPLAEARA